MSRLVFHWNGLSGSMGWAGEGTSQTVVLNSCGSSSSSVVNEVAPEVEWPHHNGRTQQAAHPLESTALPRCSRKGQLRRFLSNTWAKVTPTCIPNHIQVYHLWVGFDVLWQWSAPPCPGVGVLVGLATVSLYFNGEWQTIHAIPSQCEDLIPHWTWLPGAWMSRALVSQEIGC